MLEKIKSWFSSDESKDRCDSRGPIPHEAYLDVPPVWEVSEHARLVADAMRNATAKPSGSIDASYPPAIFLHGVMPRCGSVYVGNLIKLHLDIEAYPNQLWEWPFLGSAKKLEQFNDHFLNSYSQLDGKFGKHDLLAMFGAVSIGYLYSLVTPGKRLFMKEPRAEFLGRFFELFPNEKLVLLIRDGRDVVNSTVLTWPHHNFDSTCQLWKDSALLMHRISQQYSDRLVCAKFEDIVTAPRAFVEEICKAFDLDVNRYPFDQIQNILLQGSSKNSIDGNVSWNPVEKPSGFNPVGRWHDWSAGQKQTFKRIAGEALIETGYAKNLDW